LQLEGAQCEAGCNTPLLGRLLNLFKPLTSAAKWGYWSLPSCWASED
jgi:hypothetical protein